MVERLEEAEERSLKFRILPTSSNHLTVTVGGGRSTPVVESAYRATMVVGEYILLLRFGCSMVCPILQISENFHRG